MPQTGLYESLITEALAARISGSSVSRAPLHEAEAADRLSLHVAAVLERAIASLSPTDRVAVGAALAATLVDQIVAATAAEALGAERPVAPAEMLRSVLALLPDGRPETIGAPLIPLLDTTLLTNAFRGLTHPTDTFFARARMHGGRLRPRDRTSGQRIAAPL